MPPAKQTSICRQSPSLRPFNFKSPNAARGAAAANATRILDVNRCLQSLEPRGFEPVAGFVGVDNHSWTVADKFALDVLRSDKRK